MRVLFCKNQCPFICFCKPSSHIYTHGSLRLENTPQTSLQTQTQTQTFHISEDDVTKVTEAGEKDSRPQKQRVNVNENDNGIAVSNQDQNSGCLQSILRKSPPQKSESAAIAQKKKVQWLDFLGKDLAQIREFESSEAEDTEYESVNGRGCVCNIL